jgi:hypothetical protein
MEERVIHPGREHGVLHGAFDALWRARQNRWMTWARSLTPPAAETIDNGLHAATRAQLTIARVLLLVGLGIGLLSWREAVDHIGNADFLVPAYPLGATHSWYHVFREVCGDVAKMTVFLLLFFGSPRWRTPTSWWIGLVLMLGYYAPFWIGEPFLPELSAPNNAAAIVHIVMALFAFSALIVVRPAFNQIKDNQL